MPSHEIFPLRAHHGMCLAYYRGKGYSSEFSEGMSRTLDVLLRENREVRLISDTDQICKACPQNTDGFCKDRQKVFCYDRKVLTMCGLREGEILPFLTFAGLVQERILTPGLRGKICFGCRWERLCGNGKSRWETLIN